MPWQVAASALLLGWINNNKHNHLQNATPSAPLPNIPHHGTAPFYGPGYDGFESDNSTEDEDDNF